MRKAGFTLIELLVVVIIIGILTAIAMPQYRRAIDRSRAAEAMQLLPAIFEARERWIIEHQYHWDNSSIVDSEGQDAHISLSMLDIEAKGTMNGWVLTTKNFDYTLIAGETNQACVKAVPRWGAGRGLTSANIFYRGDKFFCTDGNTGACDILNIADANHRYGCE